MITANSNSSRIITVGKPIITITTNSMTTSSMTTSSMTTNNMTTNSITTMITTSSHNNRRQTNTTPRSKKTMTGTTKPSFQGARNHSKNRPSSCQPKSSSTART